MPLDPPDWSEREARMQRGSAPAKPEDLDDWKHLNPRLFRTRDGRVWLERMTAHLFEHPLGIEPSEARLRYAEAQRDLIRWIKADIKEAERKEQK